MGQNRNPKTFLEFFVATQAKLTVMFVPHTSGGFRVTFWRRLGVRVTFYFSITRKNMSIFLGFHFSLNNIVLFCPNKTTIRRKTKNHTPVKRKPETQSGFIMRINCTRSLGFRIPDYVIYGRPLLQLEK